MRPRRTVASLAFAVIWGVAVLVAGCASSSTSSTAPSSASSSASSAAAAQPTSGSGVAIHFPATLFGLPHNTSAQAQLVASKFTQTLAMLGMFSHPHAALYGSDPSSALVMVGITELSARAKKYGQKITGASLRTGFLMQGSNDVQVFHASGGVRQACGHANRNGIAFIMCLRADTKTVGMVVYVNGAASSLNAT